MNSVVVRLLALLALILGLRAEAATPSSGALSPATPTLDYVVGPFSQSNPTPIPDVDDGPRCNLNFPCDSYQLTVTVPVGYVAANPNAKVRISTRWAAASPSDYDLHIYAGVRGDLDGSVVADVGASASSANPEVYEFVPVDGATTTYTIKVVPYAVTPMEAVSGKIELLADAPDACDGVIPASLNAGSRIAKPMVQQLNGRDADEPYAAYVHFAGGSAAEHRALLQRVGLRVAFDFERSASAVFAAGSIAGFRALLDDPTVVAIKASRPIRMLGETGPWASRSRVAQEAVSGGPYTAADGTVLRGEGVTVVVIDTGLNATHRDFAGRVLHNYKIVGDPIVAPETIQVFDLGPNSDTDTTSGHGTHVSGIVAGSGLESTGLYPVPSAAPNIRGTFTGAAPAAKLIVYSVGEAPDPGLVGVGTLIYIDAALSHTLETFDTVAPKIRAVSLSLGDGPGSLYNPSDVTSCVVKALVAKGTNVVFAASNDGGTGSADMTSSFCKDPTPGVICVASYDDGESGRRDGALSSFSSRGKQGEPDTYPDIAAPGSNITATCVGPEPGQTTCATGAETRWAPWYGTISGTSMATPHVSGVVALMAQARPSLTPAQIELAIQDAALKVASNGPYEADPQNTGGTHNFGFGAGLLDVPATLDALGVAHPGLAVGGSEIAVLDGDADAAIAGAADVVRLTLQEGTSGADVGITYRLTLRNALDFGSTPALTYRVAHNVDGNPVSRDIDATIAGVSGGATRVGNVVSFFVPYRQMLYPPVGAPIHNIEVDVLDGATGAFLDAAPSPADSTGESAQQQPMYGKPFTVRLAAPPPPPVYEDTCVVPGITLFNDPEGDDNPPLPTAANGSGDLLSLHVSEPTAEPGKLVFTLRLRSLAALPPNAQWTVVFFGPPKGTNTTGKWHVEMETNETSTPAFSYGRYSPANQNLSQGPLTAEGDETAAVAMAGSSYDAGAGTITLKVNKSNFNLSPTPPTLRDLSNISAVVYQLVGAAGTGSLQIIDEGAGTSTYRTRLAGACPNSVPIPTLAAAPVAGNAPLVVGFTAAATDPDGDAIVEYHFEFGDGAAVAQSGANAIHTYDDSGTFAASVRVRDARGLLSLASAPVNITVAAPNSAPIAALGATPTQGQAPLLVQFDASGSSDPDAGDSIASFTISYGDGTPSQSGSSPTFAHSYVSAGVYTAQLYVTDSRGRQSANVAEVVIDVGTVPPATVPGAPTIGAATPGDGQAEINFSPPASDGGSTILSYTVTCTPSGAATGPGSPLTVAGLSNGVSHECSVRATNAVGTGPASATVSVTPMAAATPPGAPTIGAATPGDGRASIAFTPPVGNGGAQIVFYTVSCTSAAAATRTGNGPGSPIEVTDLVNGMTYECSVTATNAAGTGPASATVSVTPSPDGVFANGFEGP
jgi:serine protease AprX